MSHMTVELAHMSHLLSLTNRRPYELGPIPTDLPDDVRATAIEQLAQARLVDSDGTSLTPLAASLVEPLGATEQSYWGTITLHNQRQPIALEVDDHWMPLIGEALRTAALSGPRVYFLITRTGPIMTTAVRAADQFTLAHHNLTGVPFHQAAATFINELADPSGAWRPAPITATALPYTALEGAPARGYPADATEERKAAYRRYVSSWTSTLSDRLSPQAIATLNTLLTADHVAAASILYTHSPELLTTDHSVTLDFFHQVGTVVTHPRTIADGTVWKHLAPGTTAALSDALQALPSTPQSARMLLATPKPAAAAERVSAEVNKHLSLADVAAHVDPSGLTFTTVTPGSPIARQLREHFTSVIVPAWIKSGAIAVYEWDLAADCDLLPASVTLDQIAENLDPHQRQATAAILDEHPEYSTLIEVIAADLALGYRMTLMMGFAALHAS